MINLNFNTIQFIGFAILFISIYFVSKLKYRLFVITFFSILFLVLSTGYASILILFSVVIDFFGCKYFKNQKFKLIVLFLLIISNVIIIVFARSEFISINYLSIFRFNIDQLANTTFTTIGFSFIILRKISYIIESYRGTNLDDNKFVNYICYLTFFPTYTSGPIERPQNFIPQLGEKLLFQNDQVIIGLRLILWGFFKKIVIADRLNLLVSTFFSNPEDFNGFTALTATYFYSFQIYIDFSSYTDIAIGFSRILGINVSENFYKPYSSKSIKEFWTKWHITLSFWLRDYIFLPTAYFLTKREVFNNFIFRNIKENVVYIISISITWIIGGIWHGLTLNFFIWGMLFSFYLSFAHITRRKRKRFVKYLSNYFSMNIINIGRVFLVFNLVTISWVFFRTENYEKAIIVFTKIFNITLYNISSIVVGMTKLDFIISISGILIIIYFESINERFSNWLQRKSKVMRWALYYFMFLSILFLGVYKQNSFIYINF